MTPWTPFPHDASPYRHDEATLRRHWQRLHAGDVEPLPEAFPVLAAWALFHAGEFQRATEAGLAAVADALPAGLAVANRAQLVYATYLEKGEAVRQTLFLAVAERAGRRATEAPDDVAAWYALAYSLGRYAQSISVATALAQGLGIKIRQCLETTIRLAPGHAEAHLALGAFHAEIIDKVGSLLGRTQGASKDAGLTAFRTALRLAPDSPVVKVEFARGLVMLEGDKWQDEATALCHAAAACEPLDAIERLQVEMARAELED